MLSFAVRVVPVALFLFSFSIAQSTPDFKQAQMRPSSSFPIWSRSTPAILREMKPKPRSTSRMYSLPKESLHRFTNQLRAAATWSRELRAKGVQAYGIEPVQTAEDRKRIHGNDERLQIAGFGKFVEFLYAATVDLAGAK
jgi:hypothetical protein